MRIFVTGASGFVGWNVARDLAARGHDVVAAVHVTRDASLPVTWAPFALEAPEVPGGVDAIFHAAAIATVKGCDDEPARAEALHVDATRTLALEARRRGIGFALASTDLVFDGDAAPYAEDAPPRPTHVYGATKQRAEQATLDVDADHHVLRLSLVVGARAGQPAGFLSWLVPSLAAGKPTPLFTNQIRTPLFVGDVAPVVEAALTRRLPGGIHHLASARSLSREEIGRAAASAFALPSEAIVPTLAPRPAPLGPIDDCSLRTDRVRAALGISFTPLETALAQVRAASRR